MVSYNVYRGASTSVFNLIASGLTTGYYQDTDVTNGETYYYAVTCIDANGNEGPRSNWVYITPTGYVEPVVENFTVNALSNEGGGLITADVTAGFNKAVDYKLVAWAWNEAEPAHAGIALVGAEVDTLDSVGLATTEAWPTADEDSTVAVTWAPGDPAPATGYLLDVLIDNGTWQALGDTTGLGAAAVSYVHADTSTVPVQRGKLEYRAQAVSEGKLSPVTVTQEAVYNDAVEMLFRLYVYDGTQWAQSDVVRFIGVRYPASEGGGTKYELQEE